MRGALVALCVSAATLSAGCAYGPEEDGTSAEALSANARTVFDYFVRKGLTEVQAAGIVGNLEQESRINPRAVQAGGPGRGIAQWSVGGRWDSDPGDNVAAYARMRGESIWSLSLQLDFIWFELTNFSYYGLASLRAATTVSAATIAFERRYEGCGTCEEATRIRYATEALRMFGTPDRPTWGASFVSQSFPVASAGSVSIRAGGTARVSITMRNTGSHAWDSRTCIATTEPRDRRSVFAGTEWRGPNRPACVPAGTTVASGSNHTFTWTMHAPAATGRYDEHWGMVQEGVSWFSAAGEGGPPDGQLEGIFVVTAAPPPADAGARDAGSDARASDAAAGSGDDAGDDEDASASTGDGGGDERDGGAAGRADASADGGDGGANPGGAYGGCSAAGSRGARGYRAGALGLLVATLVGQRRRRRSR